MFKVMFVDDEEPILKITKLLLNSLGFEVICAKSGEMAIDILSDKDEQQQIGIIFLDLTMPKISGLDVLKWINQNKIKIPTVMQTGIEDEREIKKAMALGAKEYMIKPYKKEQLYNSIMKYANFGKDI